MSREYTHLSIHPKGHVDPEKTRVRCEAPGCKNDVLLGLSYSFLFCMATTGPHQPIAPILCEEAQHFTCSPACAKAAGIACMDHLIELLQAQEAANIAAAAAAPAPAPAAPELDPADLDILATQF